MTDQHLTTEELAKRWGMSAGSIENWRKLKKGPPFMKFGKWRGARVLYPIASVLEFEKRNMVQVK